MAKRQDSGSNPAHQNERPAPHKDDALPEVTDLRGRASDEDDDEFEDTEELEEEEGEGTF
jgi:hypothetical protein